MPPGEPSHVRPRTRTIQNTPPLQAAIADPAGRTSTTSGAGAQVKRPVWAATHPADEFVLVLSGTIETGGRRCEAGTFWTTPAGTRQGPHVAVTEVELLTVRLGAMGPFGDDV